MAQTDTYTNLLGLIEARMGASFGTTEQTRLGHLINSRAHLAYRESDLWENFLVIGEERAVNASGVIPYTGAVFDATEGLTDQNPYTGTVDAFLRIHKVKPWDDRSALEYEFAGVGGGARLMGYNASYGLSQIIDSATSVSNTITIELGASVYVDYYVGGTIQLSGLATTLGNINGIQTITSVNTASWLAGRTQVQFEATVTDGSWTLDGTETAEAPVAFCTYKKRLTGTTYGTGSGETSAIPIEWFEYIAHGSFADMLRADQQYEAAAMEDRSAAFALQLELERLDAQHAAQSVGQSIMTHLSEQGRTTNH